MRITLGYFFSPTFTLLYPEEKPVIPPGHRGLHGFNEADCGLCMSCSEICPVDCITVEGLGKGKNAMVTHYDVDYSRCLFCDLCATVCPTKCVYLTERYNLAASSREGCVLHLASPKTEVQLAEHQLKLDQIEAERKAKVEAARKAKAEATVAQGEEKPAS
jgi:NADH-quinone oxidoreductase subunit I